MKDPGWRPERSRGSAGGRGPLARRSGVDRNVLSLAQRLIGEVDRAHPADQVLRVESKNRRELSPPEKSELSRLVFSYFRWRGWLDLARPVSDQVKTAIELAERFRKDPSCFPDDELLTRAVPAWARDEIGLTVPLARALQTEPLLWLRARAGQGAALAARLGHCRAAGRGALADVLAYTGPEDLFRTAPFHRGEFELQDISSQAVGLICAPAPGSTWWDACAGEGGKLLHLSDLMGNRGLIWASDRATWRLDRLKRRAARAKVFNYRNASWDGGPKLPTRGKFDGVLVDAPCSGTGTWQRNPHARWTLTPEDLRELAALQLQLLTHAAAAVKPGGKLVFSVCSLARSETIDVVEAFERTVAGFAPLAQSDPLQPGSAPLGRILLLPQTCGGNGMFVATWIRES